MIFSDGSTARCAGSSDTPRQLLCSGICRATIVGGRAPRVLDAPGSIRHWRRPVATGRLQFFYSAQNDFMSAICFSAASCPILMSSSQSSNDSSPPLVGISTRKTGTEAALGEFSLVS